VPSLDTVAISGYVVLISRGSLQATRLSLAPVLGDWLANAVFTAVAATVLTRRFTQAH
jgi:hypothetical protein